MLFPPYLRCFGSNASLKPSLNKLNVTLNPGNKAFDEAFDKAMASLGEERDAAWEEANKALMDDMPITALYYPSFVALVNEDQVENVELTLGNSFMFSHAEIVE